MSALAKTIRTLCRELDLETDHRDLCDDELRDVKIAAQMLEHIIQGEQDAQQERAA